MHNCVSTKSDELKNNVLQRNISIFFLCYKYVKAISHYFFKFSICVTDIAASEGFRVSSIHSRKSRNRID